MTVSGEEQVIAFTELASQGGPTQTEVAAAAFRGTFLWASSASVARAAELTAKYVESVLDDKGSIEWHRVDEIGGQVAELLGRPPIDRLE